MKYAKRGCALVLVAILLCLGASCTKSYLPNDFIEQDNLMLSAKLDGELKGREGNYFDIVFGEKTTFNTIVLKEKGNSITSFSIQIAKNEIYETIYTQSRIGEYRYCAFDKVTTDKIRIIIDGADAEFTIEEVEIYNINHLQDENDSNFRVVAYATTSSIQSKENLYSGDFDVITDIIIFGSTSFDEDGKLFFQDITVGEETINGQEGFVTALSNVREVIGERDVNIHVNFLGPGHQLTDASWEEQMSDTGDRHAKAFAANNYSLTKYIGQFVNDYGVDGVFFDYEYPLKSKHWKAYSDFLVEMKKELGDITLGVALADWGINLSAKAVESVDLIEIMAYDLFDEDGDHASFSTAVTAIEKFVEKGYDPKKLDLGLPFYARPEDKASYWYDYKTEADHLGSFGNYSKQKIDAPYSEVPRYYNGRQMVYDKTAYAVNYGIGGVMIWHYACDVDYENELSLIRAIGSAVDSRLK